MTSISRRQLPTTASGVGAATMLAGAMSAAANPLGMRQGHFKQEPDPPSGVTASNKGASPLLHPYNDFLTAICTARTGL